MKHKSLKLSLILLFISSCSGISFMQFDNAPEPTKKLSSNNLMIEGIYQVNDIRNEEMNIVHETFNNNNFNKYQKPKLKNTSLDTITYFLKIFISEEFMEIKNTGNSYAMKAFNALNKNIYYDFFRPKNRIVKVKESELKLASHISDDSLYLTFSEDNKKDTTISFKIKLIDNLICFEKKNSQTIVDSIAFTQNQKGDNYYSELNGNFYLIDKDTSNSNYDIKRIEFNENKINIFGYTKIDSLIKLNKLPIKDSTGTIIYSSELLAKLKGSEIEKKILNFVKIENFEYDKDNSNNGKWFIIIISLLLLIVVAMVLKSKSKSVV
jgi:hypothetical protein